MILKQQIASSTGISLDRLPASYQIIGDILLLKLPFLTQKEKDGVGKICIDMGFKTVCEMSGIQGEFRTPSVTKIAGDDIITVHKENGILYKMDVSKIMFSKGNQFERMRLINKIKSNETIIDMFAGIGYFSLPIAKYTNARIYAIEKNPVAFQYLNENIALNKINNITAVLGDCRDFAPAPEKMANRIIMGCTTDTEKFLDKAVSILKPGGIIHYHNTYKRSELWGKPFEDLKRFGSIIEKRIVKGYAPNVFHVVVDLKVN